MIPRSPSLPCALGKGQRGAYLVIMAVGMLVLIGFVGLAVDLARQMVVHAKLQNAVDACALAAVVELNELPDAEGRAIAMGSNFLSFNLPDSPSGFLSGSATPEVSVGTTTGADGNPVPSVTCKATDTNANFFIPVLDAALGRSTMQAKATAVATGSSRACVTPLMIKRSTDLAGSDIGREFPYSEAWTAENTFSVMSNGQYGLGSDDIGHFSGGIGWCQVPFDGSVQVRPEAVRTSKFTGAPNVARGWCERFDGSFSRSSNNYACIPGEDPGRWRQYTTVAVVDPDTSTITDSACVELRAPPDTLKLWFEEGSGVLTLKYLGRRDRRCIAQGFPNADSARGPYVPALVE